MNLCKSIFMVVLVLTTQQMFGQSKRAFINITYNEGSKFPLKNGLQGPQAGFGWQNVRGNVHEFELTSISYETVLFKNSGVVTRNADLGFRYQYSIFIAKKKLTGRIKPFFGLGLSNYNYKNSNRPLTPYLYKTSYTDLRFAGYVAPGVQYTSKKNLFLSLSIPLELTTINFITNKVENPTWTARERRNTDFKLNADPFSAFKLRGGIGLLF